MTGKDLQNRLTARLSQKYDDAEADSLATILMEDVIGIPKSVWIRNETVHLNEVKQKQLTRIVQRLENYEPIQYIIGIAHFYHSIFYVDKNTLIPRPETEELVDLIILDSANKPGLKILDIGTGSGCIAITLARLLNVSQVTGTDVNTEILTTAHTNATLNNVSIKWVQSDVLLEPLPEGEWDIIVSNPPYIRSSERAQMPKNVLAHEPESALFVPDSSPLVFYKAIATKAARCLKPSGVVYCEINEFLGEETKEVFVRGGFSDCHLIQDMQGKDRIIWAKKG